MGRALRVLAAGAVMVVLFAACTPLDPFTWTQPVPAVQTAPFQHSIALKGVGCLSTSLCLAWDSRGGVLTSTSPSGGTWERTQLASSAALNAMSCTSSSLCVAVDALGGLYVSTNPAGGVWSARVLVDGTTSINGISCTANPSVLCVAVDNSGNAITSTNPTANASQWSVHYVGEFNDALDAVSCASTTMCVAVGEYGYILSSSNPTGSSIWTPETTQNQDIIIASVSCPQTNLCVAVGDGVVWSSGSPLSTSWAVKSVGATNAVVCTGNPSTLCLAVDGTGNLYWSTNPLAQTWSPGAQIDPGRSLTGVRCMSTTFCFAVDNAGNVLRSTNPTNGTSAWTSPTQIDGYNQLNAVSCTATPTALCVAVDQTGSASISGTSTPTVIDSGHWLSGISCPKTSLCVAVDTAGYVVWSTNPTGGSSAWSRASIDGGKELSAVSCTVTPTTLCLATDTSAGKIWHSTNPSGGGSSWSSTASMTSALYGVSCPTATLCAVVGQIGDAWATSKPTGPMSAWNGTNIEGGSRPIYSVSCVVSASTLCVAVDADGGILHSTNPLSAIWTGFTAGLENVALESVSCPSLSRCVAVDAGGDTLVSSTPTGPQSDWVIAEHTPCTNAEHCGSTGDGSAFSGVSCSTQKYCAAVDILGEQITGTSSS